MNRKQDSDSDPPPQISSNQNFPNCGLDGRINCLELRTCDCDMGAFVRGICVTCSVC